MGFGHSSVTVRSRNGAAYQTPPGIRCRYLTLLREPERADPNPLAEVTALWEVHVYCALKCPPQRFGAKRGVERTRGDEQMHVNQIANSATHDGKNRALVRFARYTAKCRYASGWRRIELSRLGTLRRYTAGSGGWGKLVPVTAPGKTLPAVAHAAPNAKTRICLLQR